MKNTKETKCPNCGSISLKKCNSLLHCGLTLLIATGVLMWIPIIGWIGVPICFVLGVIMLLMAPFNKEISCTCNMCKYEWIESKPKNK